MTVSLSTLLPNHVKPTGRSHWRPKLTSHPLIPTQSSILPSSYLHDLSFHGSFHFSVFTFLSAFLPHPLTMWRACGFLSVCWFPSNMLVFPVVPLEASYNTSRDTHYVGRVQMTLWVSALFDTSTASSSSYEVHSLNLSSPAFTQRKPQSELLACGIQLKTAHTKFLYFMPRLEYSSEEQF